MESLSGLVECPDWHKASMIAAIAVAVIGVALAFFSQSIFGGVGFALLGVTGGLGLWISQDALDAEALKTTLSIIREDNKKLEAAQKTEQLLMKRYKDETVRLERLTGDFRRQITDLRGVNEALVFSKTTLEQASRGLGVRNQELEHQNEMLQQRVADLTRLLEGLKQQVAQFLQGIGRFSEVEGAFQGTAATLHQDTLHVEGVERAFHVDLTKLSEELALARTEHQQFIASFFKEKEEIEEQLKHIDATTSRLQDVERLLVQKMAEMTEQESHIRKSEERLQAITRELAQIEPKLELLTELCARLKQGKDEAVVGHL